MYEFVVRYKKNTIKTLTQVQANIYFRKQMTALLAFGLLLSGTAIVFVESNKMFVILLALGCWMCISIHYPSQYLARQISKGIQDEETEYLYRFRESGVEIICGENRNHIPYKKIEKMVDSGDSICFFLAWNAGFLISKSGLKDAGTYVGFEAFLKEHTGIPLEKDVPLFLRLLGFRFQKNRKVNYE